MIKKLRKNKFSSEKGSVTLFILIAVLFFLIVSLNGYSGNKNKMVTQAEEIKAIEENYNKNLENIDEIYNDLLKDFVKTTFIKQSSINTSNKVYYNLSDWTNENIVVNVKVYSEYNPNAQLEVKVISKKTGTGVIYNKNQIDNNQVIVTENSTVIVKFGHKEQKFELTKFDKIAPTKPIITNSSQGNATNQNVSITVTSEDTLSGIDHYEWFENNAWTTRALKTENSVGKITFMAERKNLTIRFRAVDKVGNISQEATTVINLDKTAPVLSPITNSSNENWTNQPIKLSWTITENGSGIQKVQYSYDGQQWNNELEKSEWYGITIENQRNDTLYIRVIDTAGNISNVSSTKMKIDKTLPTVELGTNGGTYTVAQNSDFVQISTKITAKDSGESGLKALQYQMTSSSTIPADNDPNWKDFTNGSTITENKSGGTWYLYTKVTDNAGNRATHIQKSNPYTVNYSISYDANGGTGAPENQIKEHNKTLILSNVHPSRTGYTFMGWSTSKTSPTAEYQPGSEYTNNASVTLYAVWKAKQVEVTFVRNSSSTDNTSLKQIFTYGVAGQKFSDKGWSKTGYTLLGWNKDRNASVQQYSPLSGVSDNWINSNSPKVTIYAIWKINSYSLTINPNGGTWNNTTENSTVTQNYGTTKTIANPTPPSGYKVTFNGNGGTTPAAQTSTKSFANWTNNGSGTLSGTTYTFGAGNGTLTANYTNNAITLPSTSRTGYTFAGWYDAASGGNKIGNAGATYTPTAAKNLYAHWTINQYTLTVNPNSGTWNGTTASSSFKQNYASTKAIANPTAPAGYKVTFNGNGGSTPSAITSTKSFTSWTNGGSGTLSGTTYTFGAGNGTLTANYKNNAITLPSTTRNGYTLLGWYDAASGGNKIGNAGATYTPTTAKTLYAHWQDKTVPTMGTLTANTTAWTRGNVTLTGKARDLGSGISYYQFSTNGGLTASSGGWVGVTNTTAEISRTHTVTANGTYYFYVKDASGNVNKKSIAVTNIDKVTPTVKSSLSANSNNTYKLVLQGSDSGNSGLNTCYVTTSDGKYNKRAFSFTGSLTLTDINAGSSVSAYITDKAGNTSNTFSSATKVNYWNIDNKYWTVYIDEAVAKASNGSTITLIRNHTDPREANISKNLTINLSGFTLNRSRSFNINSGTTTITGSGASINAKAADQNIVLVKGAASTCYIKGRMTLNDIQGRVENKAYLGNTGGKLYIQTSGGRFTSSRNCVVNKDNGTTVINMSGGTIIGNPPLNNMRGTIKTSNVTTQGLIMNGPQTTISNVLDCVMETSSGTVMNAGVVYNQGTFRILGNTVINQTLNDIAVYNYPNANFSIDGANTVIKNHSSNKGTFKNYGNVWMKAGTIQNTTNSTAFWNEPGGTFSKTGGTILGSSNV